MLLHPDAQKSAQAELDRVLGGDRLPRMEDRAQLPYLEATFKELLRWEPVAPIGKRTCFIMSEIELIIYIVGVPHTITQDDIYEGYFLPAGSTVFGNTWYVDLNLGPAALFSQRSHFKGNPP
jgi:hypothetical protein